MKRKRTFFEKIIVYLWSAVVFCGVGVLALELPSYLSKLLGINLNTFTVRILLLLGSLVLYIKAKDIKDREAKEDIFDQIQNTIKQKTEDL